MTADIGASFRTDGNENKWRNGWTDKCGGRNSYEDIGCKAFEFEKGILKMMNFELLAEN